MAELRDGHTNFYPNTTYELLRSQLSVDGDSSYGLQTLQVPGKREYWVLQVRPGSSAEKAGLRRGDRIIAVAGKPLPEDPRQAYETLEMPLEANQTIEVTVQRGNQTFTQTLRSTAFLQPQLPTLQLRPDGIAILGIPNFETEDEVGRLVHQLVGEAKSKGAKAIIVDLRDNPGERVSEFASSIGAFVGNFSRRFDTREFSFVREYRDGVVYARLLDGQAERKLSAIPKPSQWDGPLVVLVNSRSASGSEFFPSRFKALGVEW